MTAAWQSARRPVDRYDLETGVHLGADEFLRQLVAALARGHHLLIMNKLDPPARRLYHLRATNAVGWSRNVLLTQITAGAYERSLAGGKRHNFKIALLRSPWDGS